jgi:hypothetical protein
LAVLVLAGPGVAHPDAAPEPVGAAAPAGLAQLPFKATLRASTHRPLATRPWRYVVRVTDLQGRPIQARARFRILFSGPTPPPPRELGLRRFRGTFEGTYRWPRATRGEPLIFRAIVTAKGATRRLSYWIRVR